MFGSERAEFVEYLKGNNIAMKNLLFKDWDPEYEAFPYPPGIGPYAVYTIDDLHEHIDYAVNRVCCNVLENVYTYWLNQESPLNRIL